MTLQAKCPFMLCSTGHIVTIFSSLLVLIFIIHLSLSGIRLFSEKHAKGWENFRVCKHFR